jgi:4-aminobutyrate aminotransferase
MGSIAFTASKKVYRHGFFPLMSGVVHVPYPDPYRQVLESLPGEDYGDTVMRYIEEQILAKVIPPDDLAGILIEPIQGEGGYIVPSPGFFPALRRLCDKYGILLIADEVQSGIGRTGKWWAIEHFGVEPDIVCTAKGIASGMPLGVMFARRQIMDWQKGAHGNTYGGNPIACAAALATISLVENEYMQNATEVGRYTKELAEEILINKHSSIGEIRGLGLMIGIEFVEDRITKKPAEQLRDAIIENAFQQGLILLGCGKSTIRLAPPLCVTREEVDEALEILDEVIMISEGELNTIAT